MLQKLTILKLNIIIILFLYYSFYKRKVKLSTIIEKFLRLYRVKNITIQIKKCSGVFEYRMYIKKCNYFKIKKMKKWF